MKKNLKTKGRSTRRTGERLHLKALPKGMLYAHFFTLPNGRTLEILNPKLGKYGAISYTPTIAFGEVFSRSVDAKAHLKLTERFGTPQFIGKVERLEILNEDGSRVPTSPINEMFKKLAKSLGFKR